MTNRALRLWLCAVFLAGGAWATHARLLTLDGHRPTTAIAYRLTINEQRRLIGSYRAALADLYYLRAVNVFGSKSEHRRGYPKLAQLLWDASLLDARFVAPYLLAGMALTSVPAHAEAALGLLARGAEHRPDVWRLPFFYAFELFERGRLPEAAAQMASAAQAPGAPTFAASLAARLAAESNEPQLAVRMLEALSQSAEDEGARALYAERRRALLWQQQCALWQRALTLYKQRNKGRDPTFADVQQSVDVPWPAHDPWGAPYRLVDGRVTSDNAERQLHVHKEGSQ